MLEPRGQGGTGARAPRARRGRIMAGPDPYRTVGGGTSSHAPLAAVGQRNEGVSGGLEEPAIWWDCGETVGRDDPPSGYMPTRYPGATPISPSGSTTCSG